MLVAIGIAGGGIAYNFTVVRAATPTMVTDDSPRSIDPLDRVARRLQNRIMRRFGKSVTLEASRDAAAKRRALFARSIAIAFQDEETGNEVSQWTVSLGRYPDWMTFSLGNGPRFEIDENTIRSYLAQNAPDGLSAPSFATVVETKQDGKVVRATIEGEPKDGQVFNVETVVDAIIGSFDAGEEFAIVPVQEIQGAVLYDDGSRTHVLKELGVGRSEFASSPLGRKKNVRKAMNEKANGIVIQSGETFSFNATLGGPITYGNGWFESLIIVNGRDLEPAPGGGICQASTTVFRAAVAAGLPIAFRKSHSLYVTYYKQYGVGLDAAVFPGKQDMRFENDTPGPMILVGMTDEEDNAYSKLYGIDDDRSVTMDGPYFGHTYKEPIMGTTLRNNQVGWIQRVTKADGTMREQLLVAQYLQLPKSVALEFTPQMHGAADLVADAR